jgi:serine/threonine-protein kinase ULK/ATG1
MDLHHSIDNIDKSKNKNKLQIYYDRLLGYGSYAKVFPGKYKNKMVAVKIISTTLLDADVKKQLRRELQVIKILQKHSHNNIAKYHNIIDMQDKMIIVMELCSGGELSKRIENTLDIKTIKKYYLQILSGYSHLYGNNIAHRDIKSANLMLTGDKKTIKIIDFGLSKVFSTDLNQTICGSPLYMAPELFEKQNYDYKTDIWSIGIVLYEMVYGKTPFHNCKATDDLKESMKNNKISFPPISQHNSFEVPNVLIEYMKKILEINPSQRLNINDLYDTPWLSDYDESLDKSVESVYTESIDLSDSDAGTDDNHDDYDNCKINAPSKPIPIKKNKSNYDDYSCYAVRDNYVSFDNNCDEYNYGSYIPRIGEYMKSQSFDNTMNASVDNIHDLSTISNIIGDDHSYEIIKKHQQKVASESGLIDIENVDDILISNIPKRTTTFEYISNGTSMIGKYIYSKSAPIASTLINGFDKLMK